LGLAKTTYIYWPIDYTPTPSFVKLLGLTKITYIYWPIDYTPTLSFIKVLKVARYNSEYKWGNVKGIVTNGKS
jgi:hypothetical protein